MKRTDLNPLLVFVMPPSLEELERRLRARNTENEETLKKRLETAKKEIEFGKEFETHLYPNVMLFSVAKLILKSFCAF